MARTPFGRGREGEFEPRPPSAPVSPSPSPGGLSAFIDQGSEFEGKLSFRDTVRIDGKFRGEIASENTLIVGESGEIEATIRSSTVVISGTVTGDVHATERLVLHKTARVEGNLSMPSLAIEEGAVVNGTMEMKGGDAKITTIKSARPRQEESAPAAQPVKPEAAKPEPAKSESSKS